MRNLVLSLSAVVCLSVPASASTLTGIYTGLLSFGDSLSDDGKAPALLEPSLGGRFSDGPVWTEYLAQEFTDAGLASGNFAIGGADAVGPDAGAAAGALRLRTFAGQVGAFSDSLGPFDPSAFFGDNPLVTVWFGANDLFGILNDGDTVPVPTIASFIADGIRSIAALGPSLDDFLVLDVPDLGLTPAYSSLLDDPASVGPAALAASALTDAFNASLALAVDDLRDEGLKIHTLSIDSLFTALINGTAPAAFPEFAGMDLRTPCTISVSDPALNVDPVDLALGVHPPDPACDDPSLRLFVDGVHPNTIAHAEIADRARAAVVPLPGALPMALGGIALLGMAARRRAA